MHRACYSSPIGALEITAGEIGIVSVLFVEGQAEDPHGTITSPIVIETIRQLDEYFQGERKIFDLPLEPQGTAFQLQVWEQLQLIPFGKTFSYFDIARQMSNTGAIRAVGAANGSNPVAIIIPCHRVIGADGRLTGYAGGLWRKEWLLRHENALPQGTLF